MAKILDGQTLAKEVRGEVAAGVVEMAENHQVTPGLAAVLVGDDPASAVYVRNKRRACDEVGIFSETFALPASTSQDELLELVDRLNQDSRFHGILVQLPLPDQIDQYAVMKPWTRGKTWTASILSTPGNCCRGALPSCPARRRESSNCC